MAKLADDNNLQVFIPMRAVDAKEYISTLCELVDEGREVVLAIAGSSMAPFLIHHRDAVMLGKIDQPPKRGDIVLFRRPDGNHVVHRVRRVERDGYYMIGDGQTETEGPVPESSLLAKVTKVRRKGQWLGPGTFWWNFFAGPWLWMIPLRPAIVRIWQMKEKLNKHNG